MIAAVELVGLVGMIRHTGVYVGVSRSYTIEISRYGTQDD